MDIKKTLAAVAAASGISVAVLTGTANVIKPQEGLVLKAYADPSNPALATICYGETDGVKFGDKHTAGECEAMLIERLPDYILPIKKQLPDLPDNRLIAYGDAAWNMGAGIISRRAKNKSTGKDITGTSIVDLERAGKWQDACDRLKQFVYAGGKKFNGLVKRREAEYKICMGDTA